MTRLCHTSAYLRVSTDTHVCILPVSAGPVRTYAMGVKRSPDFWLDFDDCFKINLALKRNRHEEEAGSSG
jgi:hypothetical protein